MTRPSPRPRMLPGFLALASALSGCNPFPQEPDDASRACAESLGLNAGNLLAETPGRPAQFGARGDSVWWRLDSIAYLGHASRIDTLPQAYDQGIQIPGQPAIWFRGAGTHQLYWWNGERTTLFPETVQGLKDWRSYGDRLLWLQDVGTGCRIRLLDQGEDKLLETADGFCASPRISGSRAAWLTGWDGSWNVMLHEDGMTRRLGRAAQGEHSLVVTDDLVAWVDSGYVLVYRGGTVDTVAGKHGESDLHTVPVAHGTNVYWYRALDLSSEVFRFDGEATASLIRYPTRESIHSLRPNLRGLLVGLLHNDGIQFHWFEEGSTRLLTLPGDAAHHLVEHRVSETRIFGLVEINPQFLPVSHPCADDRNPEGIRTFVFSVPL